jgi:hypothetical protein
MAARIFSLLACCSLFAGCVSVPVGSHQPTGDTVIALRDSGIAALNVGEFKLAAGVDPAIDKSVSARGSPIKPQNGQSFALYLKESLTADLKAAGKYDAAAPLSIQAELTENQLHAAGISQASALLAAHFSVKKGEQLVYDKLLRQESSWKSSFLGAVAIPEAINQYTEGYTRLLAQLYADQEFRKACASGP